MANFRITDNQFGPTGADRSVFEVPMIANKNGEVVSNTNPFPVTGSVAISGTGGTSGGTVTSKPFYLEVVQGNIAGYGFNHKFGAVPSMSTGTNGTIWDIDDTLYPWDALGSGSVVNIERNNGSDNGKTITVQGLDADYNFLEEDITISGTNTLGSSLFIRVNRAFVKSDGGTNAGNIDIEAGAAGGTTVARITSGYGQTLMSVFTIPAGKTAYVLQINATAGDDTDATIMLMSRLFESNSFRIKDTFELQRGGGPSVQPFQAPLQMIEKTDIDVRAITRANNKRITASFDLLLVDN